MLNREQIESNARFWQHTANIAGDTSLPNTHSDKPLRRLYFGDNLDIMGEAIPDAFVDLVYLDPPFNSDEDYNVFSRQPTSILMRHSGPLLRIPGFGTKPRTKRWTSSCTREPIRSASFCRR